MTLDTVLSIAMLGGFIWDGHFHAPEAVKRARDMALTCAVRTAGLALLAWLMSGWHAIAELKAIAQKVASPTAAGH